MTKIVFITGASSGIGLAASLYFLNNGWNVYGLGRKNRSHFTKNNSIFESSANFTYIQCDLNSENYLDSILQQIENITFDVVLHCAGLTQLVPIRNYHRKYWNQLMKVNLQAPVEITNEFLKNKKVDSGSSVIFISSLAAQKPSPGQQIYSISKAAIEAAMRSYCVEYTKKKIRFNCIAPGLLKNSLYEKIDNVLIEPDLLNQHMNKYGLGSPTEDDVIQLIYFLSTTSSQHITGQTITIDSGYLE